MPGKRGRRDPAVAEETLLDNEGEGSPKAARNYREGVEEYVKSHDPERVAEEAAKEVAANHDAECSSESCTSKEKAREIEKPRPAA